MKSLAFKIRVLIVFASLLSQGNLFFVPAQSALDSVQYIREVVVSAQSYREVIPSQKLTGKELEALNSRSVADAIRFFSGVQLKDYGGIAGLKTVNIRSMGTNHTGVFYDGIQLGNAQNGQVDLGKFSLDNIEEISLYNGQKSQIFQSAKDFGSSGTIYLSSRTPRFEQGRTANMKASLRAGSFDLLNPSLLMEHKISDRVSASFSGEWINASGKYKYRYRRVNLLGELAYDTTAVRENSDINVSRLEAGLHGAMDDGAWKLRVYNYNSERGVPGAIVNNVFRNGERLWDINSFMQGSVKKIVNERYSLLLNAKYAADYTHYRNDDVKLIKVDHIYRQKEIYLSTANLYAIAPHWDASLAYDFQWNKLDATLNDFPFPTRYSHLAALATAFEWKRIKVQASVLGNFVHETVVRYSKSPDKNEWTPAVFVAYNPFSRHEFALRAFYKRMFRMPTFNDLYYTDMGNANLKPEYVTQYNLGFVYTKPFGSRHYKKLSIQADAYYNEVTDKIVAYPKGQQFRWTMLNLGFVEVRGVDVTVDNSLQFGAVAAHVKCQYTYQKAQDFTHPADNYYGHQIPYIPWHSGSAIVGAEYRNWNFHYSFIYTGERYNQQENIRYNHTQPWYTSDLSASFLFTLGSKKMKASAEVNNLFNQDYDVILNYPMPMRNYRFYLSIDL